jgi:ribosomal protein S18 acetylase RimI-like enzyme
VAFGALLAEGIGDTIRVSLSAPPVEEVKVGIADPGVARPARARLEIVSCPSCGRAQVDVYTLADEVTAALDGFPVPLRVAVMGCVVNGPGEAREADLGVASGNGKGQIFVKGEVIKTVPESKIVETLVEEAPSRWRRTASPPANPRSPSAAEESPLGAHQPLMVTASMPADITPDPRVRRVRKDEMDVIMPACVAMFTEEVGVSPLAGDGGLLYQARVAELVAAGRSFARVEDGRVVFKAEIGAATPHACQVQGVWVAPEYRGRGLSETGMAAVLGYALNEIAPVASLYVNDYNTAARAAYRRVGFQEVGAFMSVLF